MIYSLLMVITLYHIYAYVSMNHAVMFLGRYNYIETLASVNLYAGCHYFKFLETTLALLCQGIINCMQCDS